MMKRRTRPTVKNHGYVNGAVIAEPIRRAKPGDPDYLTFDEAERLEKAYKAQEAELRIRQIEGSLVERSDVERAQFAVGRRVRDRILNVPARVSGVIAAMGGDQQQIFAYLTKELQACLEGLTA